MPEAIFLEEGTGGYYKGKNPNVTTEILLDSWVYDADILYIGATGGSLRNRIESLFKFGKGDNVSHFGGRYLWQHDDSYNFRIYWYVCKDEENPIELKSKLLNEFRDEYGKYPFANLR